MNRRGFLGSLSALVAAPLLQARTEARAPQPVVVAPVRSAQDVVFAIAAENVVAGDMVRLYQWKSYGYSHDGRTGKIGVIA